MSIFGVLFYCIRIGNFQTVTRCLLYLFLLVTVSCSRSSNNESISNTDLLVNKKWKISALSGKLANGTTFPDEYAGLPNYQKDDYWFFKTDLTFIYNDNLVKKPASFVMAFLLLSFLPVV